MNNRSPDQKLPLLSVVMPVHNGMPFLNDSIGSIVNQTFSDFEFIILDDASTDGSLEVLRQWEQKDARIRVFTSQSQLGLAGSSNLVVSKARASIVARMDADDVSHPARLTRQWEVMKNGPKVVAVGTLCDGIDALGRRTRPRDRWRLVRHSRYIPFPHGSAMFRKQSFDSVKGYGEQFDHGGEDQDFFLKMSKLGRVMTLPDVLYHFRYHSSNTTLNLCSQANGDGLGHHSQNGEALARLYLLGAVRLWSGQRPKILNEMIAEQALGWDLRSAMALASASLGSVSPATLRVLLRTLIAARDRLAGLYVKDGEPYDWRLKTENGKQ